MQPEVKSVEQVLGPEEVVSLDEFAKFEVRSLLSGAARRTDAAFTGKTALRRQICRHLRSCNLYKYTSTYLSGQLSLQTDNATVSLGSTRCAGWIYRIQLRPTTISRAKSLPRGSSDSCNEVLLPCLCPFCFTRRTRSDPA